MGRYLTRQELLAGGLVLGSCLGKGLINRVLAKPKPRNHRRLLQIASLRWALGERVLSAGFAFGPACQKH